MLVSAVVFLRAGIDPFLCRVKDSVGGVCRHSAKL